MKHPPPDILAAHARGDEPRTLRPMIEAHLAHCSACEGAVARLRAEAPPLDEEPDSDESPALFGEILARIERDEGFAASQGEESPAGIFPPAVLDELPDPARWRWISQWPARGRVAEVATDPDGARLLLLRYQARARTPRHAHVGDEHSVVLAGGYRSGSRELGPGDWDHMAPGTEHQPEMLPDGECWSLVRVGPGGLRYRGLSAWRRFVAAASAIRRLRT